MPRLNAIVLVLALVMIGGVANAGRMETPDNDYGGIAAPAGQCYPDPMNCGDLKEQVYTSSSSLFQVFAFEIISTRTNFLLTLSSTDGLDFYVPGLQNTYSYGSVYCPAGNHPQVTALCWLGTGNGAADTSRLDGLDPGLTDPINSVTFGISSPAQGLVFYALAGPPAMQGAIGTEAISTSQQSAGGIQATITPTPEPATFGLLGLALGTGAIFRKRLSL